MTTVIIPVSFNDEKHADLLAWIKSHDNRAATIRDACEATYRRNGQVSNADLLAAIERLAERGVVVREDSGDTGDEPAAAADALRGLGV